MDRSETTKISARHLDSLLSGSGPLSQADLCTYGRVVERSALGCHRQALLKLCKSKTNVLL